MPPASPQSGPLLGLRLDKKTYAPGDAITGHVLRTAHAVSPRARILVSLHGRSKSKMVVRNGQNRHVYRGRHDFFGADVTHAVLDGPLHIEPGAGASWPFAVTVPSSLGLWRSAQSMDDGQGYLKGVGGGAQLPLPSSFAASSEGLVSVMASFVEYYVQAELHMETGGAWEGQEATLPIEIRAVQPGPPISDFGAQALRLPASVSSQRLVPGMEEAKLTLAQKTHKFLGSSRVPSFGFFFEVHTPATIQLENPHPIPLLVRVRSHPSRTSEILQGTAPRVKLERLSLHLKADTEVQCDGTLGTHYADGSIKLDLGVAASLASLGTTAVEYLPVDEPAIDIGDRIGLRVGRRGRLGSSLPSMYTVYPDFTTANIKHTHRLKWELRVAIAGEDIKGGGEARVTILPPHDGAATPQADWIRPEEPPPPFTKGREPPPFRSDGEPPPPFTKGSKSG